MNAVPLTAQDRFIKSCIDRDEEFMLLLVGRITGQTPQTLDSGLTEEVSLVSREDVPAASIKELVKWERNIDDLQRHPEINRYAIERYKEMKERYRGRLAMLLGDDEFNDLCRAIRGDER